MPLPAAYTLDSCDMAEKLLSNDETESPAVPDGAADADADGAAEDDADADADGAADGAVDGTAVGAVVGLGVAAAPLHAETTIAVVAIVAVKVARTLICAIPPGPGDGGGERLALVSPEGRVRAVRTRIGSC